MVKTIKEEKIREWLKIFVPVLTAIIVVVGGGVFSIHVANNIQRKAQERSGDIAIAQTVLNVLSQRDTNLYSWLPKLIGTIKDPAFRKVMEDAFRANPSVPDSIKVQAPVNESITPSSAGRNLKSAQGQIDDTILSKISGQNTLLIIYMRTDTLSQKRATGIKDILESHGFHVVMIPSPPERYLEDLGQNVIYPYNRVRIFYSSSRENDLINYGLKPLLDTSVLGPFQYDPRDSGPFGHEKKSSVDDTIEVYLPNMIKPIPYSQ